MAPWPDPDAAMQLPVEELGLRLLERIPTAGGTGVFGRDNFLGLERRKHWELYGGSSPTISQRAWEQKVSEAFDWLATQGLVIRDATQRGDNWLLRSELGQRVLDAPDGRRFFEAHRALALKLHDSIDARVRRQLAIGEVESAILIAVRQVEIAVRDASGLGKAAIGKGLITAAFKPGEGPLHDPTLETAEQEGVMYLFMGLIAALKNPTSHRQVDYEDLGDAIEVIHFADLLLRMVDRVAGKPT